MHVSIYVIQRPACLLCVRAQYQREYFSHWGQMHVNLLQASLEVSLLFSTSATDCNSHYALGKHRGAHSHRSLGQMAKTFAYKNFSKKGGEGRITL